MIKPFLLLVVLCVANFGYSQILSEAQSSNATTLADEFGEYDDWIEIHNPSSEYIDIGGLVLKDAVDTWTIPITDAATIVAPGGYFILWADDQEAQGMFHTNFKLSANDGEYLGLFESDGETVISEITLPPMSADESHIRCDDGQWQTTNSASPLAANGCATSTVDLQRSEIYMDCYVDQLATALNLQYTGQVSATDRWVVYTGSGQETMEGALTQQQETISIEHLSPGIYVVVLTTASRVFIRKIYVSRG